MGFERLFFRFWLFPFVSLREPPTKKGALGCVCLVQTAALAAHPWEGALSGDRVTVWGEAHGPARLRSNLTAVRSIDRLDSIEWFPQHNWLWEVLGADQGFWKFTQSATLAGVSLPQVVRFGLCVLKQKYRTLHPGGNKKANVQY